MVKIFTIFATFFELNHVHVNSHFVLGKKLSSVSVFVVLFVIYCA